MKKAIDFVLFMVQNPGRRFTTSSVAEMFDINPQTARTWINHCINSDYLPMGNFDWHLGEAGDSDRGEKWIMYRGGL